MAMGAVHFPLIVRLQAYQAAWPKALVARRREHFRVFWRFLWLLNSLQQVF